MQTADHIGENPVIQNLSDVAANAYKELESTKRDLLEKELQLKEIAELANQKFHAAAKVNHDLQGKVDLMQEMSNSLKEQNDELVRRNGELKIKEKTYNTLNLELRTELEKVTSREKELEIREKYLETLVEEKSKEITRAEKLATIGELTSRIAHDLRNPLSVIKTTHGLMKSKQNLKIDERLQLNARIDRAIQKIVFLVDDVLDFVRVHELRLQDSSLLSIIETSLESVQIPSEVKIIKPKNDISLKCDFRKVEAVFTNLISNATQAIEGDGQIEIKLTESDVSAQIEIQDSGKGVPESIVAQIFDPLFTTKPYGTGLGLSICKSVIDKHGGTITVKNNPSVFTINLPKDL